MRELINHIISLEMPLSLYNLRLADEISKSFIVKNFEHEIATQDLVNAVVEWEEEPSPLITLEFLLERQFTAVRISHKTLDK